jgi:hypothetical protein
MRRIQIWQLTRIVTTMLYKVIRAYMDKPVGDTIRCQVGIGASLLGG